jgi:hypothetical protein
MLDASWLHPPKRHAGLLALLATLSSPGLRGRSRHHPNLTPLQRVCYTALCRLPLIHVSDNPKSNPENIGGSSDPGQRPGSIEIV